MPEQFQWHEDIPDPFKDFESILLSPESIDLRAPQQDSHTAKTTSPVEVTYAFYTSSGFEHFKLERELLERAKKGHREGSDFFHNHWSNHMGRAVVRVMLDPDRRAPIDMRAVYDLELRRNARYPKPGEEIFFENFVELHGVVDRTPLLRPDSMESIVR